MKLSRQQFSKLLQENKLVLSLIGMSNIGKTYWSKELQSMGFRHFNCDDLIETNLAPVLKEFGFLGLEGVSRWMGQPYEEKFAINQQKYLSLEKKAMESIFNQIGNDMVQNTVIDTTGSVIHADKSICAKLRQCSLVIYIEASEDIKEAMFDHYISEPKPVIFEDIFEQKEDETASQSLERCYWKLLNSRSNLYTEYADVVIPRQAIKENARVDHFISLIKQSL